MFGKTIPLLLILFVGAFAQTAPTIPATNIVFSALATTSFTVSWTRGNGANVAVFIMQGSSGTAAPINGSVYTANTILGSGTQIGTSGWFCIYNGTGTSVSITGLTVATAYYRVMTCEYNGTSTTTKYNNSIGVNNPANQATLSLKPLIAANNITFAVLSTSSFRTSWIRGNGTSIAVFVKNTGDGTVVPLGGSNYIANTVLGSGTQIDTSGWYCVYNGTGTTVTVTGLAGANWYSVRAIEYNGSGPTVNYCPSTNGTNPSSIGIAAPQTVTFVLGSDSIKTYGDGTFSLTASASSGLPVTFSSTNSAVATISGSTVTIVGAGTTAINSVQWGDALHQEYGVQRILTVYQRSVTMSGLSGGDKIYNGNTTTFLSGTATLNGILPVDVPDIGLDFMYRSVNFTNANVGSNKLLTITGDSLRGSKSVNYALIEPTGLTANITPRSLEITSVSASNKTYDGTNAAILSGGSLSGVVGSDIVTIIQGSGTFADKNVGNSKWITTTGYAISGTSVANYTLSAQPADLTANITTKSLAISSVSSSNKTYDGTTVATLSGGTLVGVIGSDIITIFPGSGTFADKNVGNGKTITATGYSISGTYAYNYTLSSQPSGLTANITAKPLTVTAENKSKVYGAADPALTVSYSGFVPGEDASVLSGTLSLNRAAGENYGTYAITASGLSSTNYAISYVAGTLTISGSVAQTITFGALSGKTYGAASFSLGATASSGLPVSYTSSNTNVATVSGSTVTIVGAGSTTITAAQAGNSNYAAAASVPQTLTVAQKTLSITGVTAANKTYDGTTAATLSGGSFVGVVGADVVAIIAGTGTFADKNVGTGKQITATGYSISGTHATKYALAAQPSGITASITTKALSINAENKSKNFGATDPVLTAIYSDFVAGENSSALSGALLLTRAVGEDAGTYPITASGLSSTNYAITFVPGVFTINGSTAQTITFGALAGKAFGDAPFVLTATATSGLPVAYTSSDTTIAKIAGSTVTIVGTGSITITAAQAGNVNYLAAANVPQTIVIVPAAPVIVAKSGGTIPVTPQFVWKKSTGALSYHIQISKRAVFDTLARDTNGIVDTTYLTTALSYNTKYFWRVRAAGSAGNSAWSMVDSFRTIAPVSILALPKSFSLKALAFGVRGGNLVYDLPISAHVTLKIFDLKGNCITTLIDRVQPAGTYTLSGITGSIRSGAYIYYFKAGTFVAKGRFSLTR